MELTSGFAAYAMYNALKLHFTSDYDYTKYHGKTNVSKSTFTQRKDKFYFYRLSRKYTLNELKDFLVANFIARDIQWANDLLNEEAEQIFKDWKKRNQSLTYTFGEDLYKVLKNEDTPDSTIEVTEGQHPKLLRMAMQGDISLETLIIMNDIMGFFGMWSAKIDDDIIWPNLKMKCEKYSSFLFYDKNKYKVIIKDAIQEYAS